MKLLANEEDTVTVGQDLFIMEPGACTLFALSVSSQILIFLNLATPAPKEQSTNEEPADLPKESKTKDPEEPKDQQVEKALSKPPPPSESDKQGGGAKPSEKPKESKKDAPKVQEKPKAPIAGSRGETRVSLPNRASETKCQHAWIFPSRSR